MTNRRIAATGAAGLLAAALLGMGVGVANAATTEPCPGTGPAASLSEEKHDAFQAEMDALKVERDAIMAEHGLAAPVAGQGQRAGRQSRGAQLGSALTEEQRTAMQEELAAWRVKRDALFAEYGLTARSQGGRR